MRRLIATPPGWIERDDDPLMRGFLIDDADQVLSINGSLRDPTPGMPASHALGMQDRSSNIVLCDGELVPSEEGEFRARVGGEAYGFGHGHTLARAYDHRHYRASRSLRRTATAFHPRGGLRRNRSMAWAARAIFSRLRTFDRRNSSTGCLMPKPYHGPGGASSAGTQLHRQGDGADPVEKRCQTRV